MYLAESPAEEARTSHQVLRSRAELLRGQKVEALERAKSVAKADATSPIAVSTLAAIAFRAGEIGLAWEAARTLASTSQADETELLGLGYLSLIEASVDADLRVTREVLSRLREAQHRRGHSHHEAISLLNLALQDKAMGDTESIFKETDLAMSLLAEDRTGAEMAAARAVRAWALAHRGNLEAARELFLLALGEVHDRDRAEILLEEAETELWYGSGQRADDCIAEARNLLDDFSGLEPYARVVEAEAAIRAGRLDEGRTLIDQFHVGDLDIVAGLKAQQLVTNAIWTVRAGRSDWFDKAQEARGQAEKQRADFWIEVSRLLEGCDQPTNLNREIRRLSKVGTVYLSVVAEVLVERLHWLTADELVIVQAEMGARSERWLPALRVAVDAGADAALNAARCLDLLGRLDDVPRLRRFGKRRSGGDANLGRGLARRVADQVFVEDQGRVALRIGVRLVEGTGVRRKVLTMLCFLLARPRFSSTRDEVLDALWPESEPSVALNSLNQTLYFLRRVFEPTYREDTSPGYVRHESDVIWLDRQLVSSRSQVCADFVRSLGPDPAPEEVRNLTSMYRGQFALDFAYEDWAVAYRDTLHASYLQVIERSVAADMATGHWDRGIITARLALSVDPDAEQIEASLVRLLRLSGAHAAAAEQYAHYSAVLKNGLGIDPPPLDAL
jgi:DNA-binding SARP family transcriptional activator